MYEDRQSWPDMSLGEHAESAGANAKAIGIIVSGQNIILHPWTVRAKRDVRPCTFLVKKRIIPFSALLE
jgi:hypothetical protein